MSSKKMTEEARDLCQPLNARVRESQDICPERSRGRPTKYSPEIGVMIAEIVAKGIPLAEIMHRIDVLSYESIRHWQTLYPDFAKLIAEARVEGFERYGRRRLGIAEDTDANKRRWQEIEASELRGACNWQLLRSWDPRRWKAMLVAQVRQGASED